MVLRAQAIAACLSVSARFCSGVGGLFFLAILGVVRLDSSLRWRIHRNRGVGVPVDIFRAVVWQHERASRRHLESQRACGAESRV